MEGWWIEVSTASPAGTQGRASRTQMSTFSSSVVLVLTSNSSGARYGIDECSLARSCWSRASWRVRTGTRARTAEPRSIRIGEPSSATMTLLGKGESGTARGQRRERRDA